ncbi:hypothetical protein MNBD_CHLOROFLEXI01-2001 [hydrothermal vent metagenome]|uniref:Uncharacterized protein n=1 Tax=hydrothermal vent metagenome TaxID=652676 RepID=A0A3B0V800_9ZZZZ
MVVNLDLSTIVIVALMMVIAGMVMGVAITRPR